MRYILRGMPKPSNNTLMPGGSKRPQATRGCLSSAAAQQATRSSALQSQFCMSVEVGDSNSVRDMIRLGVDPTIVYSVDGRSNTALRSSLSKGYFKVVGVLLEHPDVKATLEDLQGAMSKYRKTHDASLQAQQMTPQLISRLASTLSKESKDALMQSQPPKKTGSPTLLSQVREYLVQPGGSGVYHGAPQKALAAPLTLMASDEDDSSDEDATPSDLVSDDEERGEEMEDEEEPSEPEDEESGAEDEEDES